MSAHTFKRYLIAGVLFWIPVWVTVTVVRFCVRLMDRTLALLPEAYRPDTWLGVHIPGFGFVLVVLVLLLTGALVANIIGRSIVSAWESLVSRIPLVRSIYQSVQQALQVVFSSSGRSFRDVLLIEYPRVGTWSVAFLTNDGFKEAQKATGKKLLTVFVPTTPNPTSGFLLMVPEDKTIKLNVSVEKALKLVISLGTVLPDDVVKEK